MYPHSNSKTIPQLSAINTGTMLPISLSKEQDIALEVIKSIFLGFYPSVMPTTTPASPSPFYISSLQIMLEYSFLHEFNHDNFIISFSFKILRISSLNSAFFQLLDTDSWCYTAVSCVLTLFLKLSPDNLS